MLSLVLVFVLLSGASCKVQDKSVTQKMESVKLTYWRVWDGPDTFSAIINKYQENHPFVKIEYKLLRYEEYEQKLLEAFASDRAPDIFSIHNTWTRKYHNRGWLKEMPAETTMVYPEVKGSIKKEIVPTLRKNPSPSLNEIRSRYVDTVYDDVVIKGKDGKTGVYGLPMGVDTLLMFVNRDLFNNAGITSIPEYWNKEFQQTVRRLTKMDNKGQIIQSGVALGVGGNIDRSSDILSILMMQNGAEMMNLENTLVTFNAPPIGITDKSKIPGEDALRFYSDFANPAKEIYAWNNTMDNSLDLFIRGKLAIMFGYSYMMPQIKAGNPKMNLVISRLPQIEGNDPVNFANYWVETVASKSKHQNEAWDFIKFATAAEQVPNYLEATKKLSAIRTLVEYQKQDLEVGPYADQVLTAKSWYKGNDAGAAEKAMRDMMDSVAKGEVAIKEAIGAAVSKVQQTVDAEF